MIGFLILLFHVLILPFKTRARLEAEIVLLRHQLSVLRQRVPSKADGGGPTALRLALSAVSVGVERYDDHPTGDRHAVAPDGLSVALALEVALRVGVRRYQRRSAGRSGK